MAEEGPRDEFDELLGEDHADFPLEEEQAAGGAEAVGKGTQEEGPGEHKADAAATTPEETTDNNDLLGRNEDTVDGLLDDYEHEDFFGEGDQHEGHGQAPQGEGVSQAAAAAPSDAAGGAAPERARPEAYDMDASALGSFEEEGPQLPFQQHQRGRGGWGPSRGGPMGPGAGGGRFGGPEGPGFQGSGGPRGGGGGGYGRGRFGFGGGWEGGRGRGGWVEGGGAGVAGPGLGGWPLAFPPGMPPGAQRRMMVGMGMPVIPLMPGTLVPDLQQQAALQQQLMRSMQGQLSTPHPSHPHHPLGASPASKNGPQPLPLPPPAHGRSPSQPPHNVLDKSMGASPLARPPAAAFPAHSGPEPGEIGDSIGGQQAAGARVKSEGAPPLDTSAGFNSSSGTADLGVPSSSGSLGTPSLQGPGHLMHPLGPGYAPGRNTQQGMGLSASMPMHSAGVPQPTPGMRAGLQQPVRQGPGVVGGGGSVSGVGSEFSVQGGRGGVPASAASMSSMVGAGGFGVGRGAGRRSGAGRGMGGVLPGDVGEGGYLGGGVFPDGWSPVAASAALLMQGGGWAGGKFGGGQMGGGGPLGGALPLQPPSLPGAAGTHSGTRPPHLHARPLGGLHTQSGPGSVGGGLGVDMGEGKLQGGGLAAGQPNPFMQATRPPTHKWVRPELAAAAAASGMAVEEMEQQQTQQQKSAELQRKLAIIAQKREEQAKAKAAAAAAAAAQGGDGGGGASTVKAEPKPTAPPPKPLTPQQQLELQKQELLRKQEEYMQQLRKMIAIKEAEQKAKTRAGKGPSRQSSEAANAPQSQQQQQQQQPPLKRPSGQPGLHQDASQGTPKHARTEPASQQQQQQQQLLQQQQQQQQQQQRVGRRLQPAAAVLQQFGNGEGATGRREPNGNEFCEELEQAQQERRRRQQQGEGGGFMEEGLENLEQGFEGLEYAEGEGLLAQGVGLEYVEREEGGGFEGAHYGEDLQGGGGFGGQGGGQYGGQYGEVGGFGVGGAGFDPHDPHAMVDEGLMGGGMEGGFEEQEELPPQGAVEAAHYPEDFHGLDGMHSDLQRAAVRGRDGAWDERGEGSEAVDRGRREHRSKGSSGRRLEYDPTGVGGSGSSKHKDRTREGRGSSGSRTRHREHKDRKRHRQEHDVGRGAGVPMGMEYHNEQLPPPPPLPEMDLRAQIEAARRMREEGAQYHGMEEQRYGNGEKRVHRKNHKRRH